MVVGVPSMLALPRPPQGGHANYPTLYFGATGTTTTNENTTTFTAKDLVGPAHPKRVIVLCVWAGVSNNCTGTIDGIPQYHREQNGAFAILLFQVPNGDGAIHEIAITAASSLTKAFHQWAVYPDSHAVVDSGNATANTTTDANVANLKFVQGGIGFYSGGQNATLGAFSTTWNGTASVTEATDAQLEAGSYTFGHIGRDTNQPSSDVDDLNMAETVSGTKQLAVVMFGPPYRYAA